MDQTIIKTTIPLSPSLINQYCQANSTGNNHILFEFDVSSSPLSAEHILGYLSNLKIDFRITGYDIVFINAYLNTQYLVGESNLVDVHALALTTDNFPFLTDVIREHLKLIHSLPLFLIESSDTEGRIKNAIVGEDQRDTSKVLPGVGVNFVHLVKRPELFLQLIGDKVYDWDNQMYYTHYFDEYIYGGDKLIQFFIDNPDNLLNVVVQSKLAE